MQSGFTGHVTSLEWRWVIIVSTVLVALAFTPFLWVLLAGIRGSEWQFMGAIHDYQTSATVLSQIYQGANGAWQFEVLHTPEPHNPAFIAPLYAVLGQISRLTSLSPIAIFHAARVGAALFMYLAIYQLGAMIWMRIRTRRVFFLITAVGSGFGWLLSPLTQNTSYLDLTAPQAFPFFSSLVNVHYPITIAILALLASLMITLLRPDDHPQDHPTISNGGGVVALMSLGLTLVYPLALIPITLVFGLILLIDGLRQRQLPAQWRWFTWLVIPALPLLVYYTAVLTYNDVISIIWWQEHSRSTPTILVTLLSLGLPLLVAFPGIFRAVRRFESDGDQFMLLWLVLILVLFLLPIDVQRPFIVAVMVPIAYFATRSIEDFWFQFIKRRWRLHILTATLPILAASNILVLVLPLRPISANNFEDASGMLLQQDYITAFEWLRLNSSDNTVVLAAPETGLWMPVWAGTRPVAGHPVDTLQPDKKEAAVERWYTQTEAEQCVPLLRGAFRYDERDYTVRYILVGPQETNLGESVCIESLILEETFGRVFIYTYTPDSFAIRR